jgi:hypothetical protein
MLSFRGNRHDYSSRAPKILLIPQIHAVVKTILDTFDVHVTMYRDKCPYNKTN